uniref:Uncharacterized protein n=1 Tax=Arundo donax TaxID=35708 RepID=A0A0A9GC36_ARUDO
MHSIEHWKHMYLHMSHGHLANKHFFLLYLIERQSYCHLRSKNLANKHIPKHNSEPLLFIFFIPFTDGTLGKRCLGPIHLGRRLLLVCLREATYP